MIYLITNVLPSHINTIKSQQQKRWGCNTAPLPAGKGKGCWALPTPFGAGEHPEQDPGLGIHNKNVSALVGA